MNILIIEDEAPAARRLAGLVQMARPLAKLLGPIDSIESAVLFFENSPAPNLIFMDIQLADGLSFDIFSKTTVAAPVIFTTAFDQYMLRAFKVHSVDYLLKPIGEEELAAALDKFDRYFLDKKKGGEPAAFDPLFMEKMIQNLQKPTFKERFLVKTGQTLGYLPVGEVAYFFSEDSLTFAQSSEKKFILDQPLDQIEGLLDPSKFFRISRKLIVSIGAVAKIHTHLNGRLKLDILPKMRDDVFVSRERVGEFKGWLDR